MRIFQEKKIQISSNGFGLDSSEFTFWTMGSFRRALSEANYKKINFWFALKKGQKEIFLYFFIQ
jgi:hypothetical protein